MVYFFRRDTQAIYQGDLPGRAGKINSPRDIISFLYESGNRWEQVVRCIGPLGISQNQPIPLLIVVEDSLWAQRIAQKLGKPEWETELQKGFKSHAQETSESLVTSWLSVVTGARKKDVFFFYTSDLGAFFREALTNFRDSLFYRQSKETLDNMPVILMYTGFWLEMLKKMGQFRNKEKLYTLPANAQALVAEVDSHFRLRGKENDYLGSFFWENQPGAKDPKGNPNRDVHFAGYFQPRIPSMSKKLIPAYAYRHYEVLNAGNRGWFVDSMAKFVKGSEKIYPFLNPIALEAISSLYWDYEARFLLQYLTLLPKEALEVRQNSARAVDEKYTPEAKKTLLELLDKLNELYKLVGYQ